MSKKLMLIGLVAILAFTFVVVQCSRDPKNPVGTIQTTAKIQVDGTDPLAPPACTEEPSDPVGIVPTYVYGNTPAEDAYHVKIDPPNSGTYALGTGFVTISFSTGACGEVMTWSVTDNIVIEHVYAKGGPAYNDYNYTGVSPHPTTDGNIHCPVNPSGKFADFSHVNFVFHYKLTISKTADTEYTRTYDWTINKVGDKTTLELSVGQTFTVNYDVTVGATYTDSDWKVTGKITIFNNTPLDAVITSISDVAGSATATLWANPEKTVPFVISSGGYSLAAGVTLEIYYSADLNGAVNGTNTVTVVTSTPKVEGGTATKAYAFGDPTTYTDECIDVTDDQKGPLGTVCYADLPETKTKIFEYTLDIVYNDCGEFDFVNVASFVTNDNGITGSDSWTVAVTIPCAGGCTLTQGYWKTHSHHGPAPEDNAWFLLGDVDGDASSEGADETFFYPKNTQTYYQVLWTAPSGGNAYYILAHQYIAAKLNILNGASSTPEVDTALAWATNFFNNNAPTNKLSKTVSQQAKSYADLLDQYNNGLIGPGHCSE